MQEVAISQFSTGVISYDEMCRAISVCHSTDEVKMVRDQAEAIRVYAFQAKNIEAERQAAEIRIRAERRWGQLYRDSEKPRGGDRGNQHTGGKVPQDDLATLDDMAVSKNQSSRWQQLADSSDKNFEKALNKAGAKIGHYMQLSCSSQDFKTVGQLASPLIMESLLLTDHFSCALRLRFM